MSHNLNNNIWLIGAGQMAVDYYRVLNDLDLSINVIGRGKLSANIFSETTGLKPFIGGLDKFLSDKPKKPSHAIVAVGAEKLTGITKQLLEYDVKNLLIEKPAGLNKREIKEVVNIAKAKKANVYVGYNRRFYASVMKAKEIIKYDGGVTSFNFEFTEWTHVIEQLQKTDYIKEHWFLGNSTHVVDLAFYLGGKPKEISPYSAGGLSWHPSASIFSGAGVSETGALFSYKANWESAGRWGVEVLTKRCRLIFQPLEKLKIQKRGSIEIKDVEDINYSLDQKYKPGLFNQTKTFLSEKPESGCIDISSHLELFQYYLRINS
jgi:predicted dehydrogenase